ncbi:MAG TPA: transcription termination/antitermination protein NusG [Fibrobacteria bacterium]|nr:transcription termination/antitermination protein NusG [Fibrobacteria bacterium]
MKKWYVVHTYSGQEGKVKQHLEALVDKNNMQDFFGNILLPTREVTTVQKGKKTTRDKKFYPSYLLVEMEMNKDTMHYVTDIPGVTHFVGVGKPQPLRRSEVERILGQSSPETTETGVVEIPFNIGEKVRIKDGPFKDFDGVVEEINPEKGKLKVMVSVFGRSTPVELDFVQVDSV